MHITHQPPLASIAKQQRGVTLVEVIVTVLIMSIGLLGMAAMQNTSLKLAYDSYLRTQASFLAYDLIDRIRANPGMVYQLSDGAAVPQKSCFNGDDCSQADLRQHDLYYWKQQSDQLLPNASLSLEFDEAISTYSMKLKWDDRYAQDVEGDETKEFVYHFQVDPG